VKSVDSASYKNYLLAVLLTIYAFNFVDRFALGLVLNDIKSDLHLSDSELGVLGGIAFALCYSVMGIPIALWADRGNRVKIIAVTAALWSVMVAVSGWAKSFLQLLLVRTVVGIGEAGCVPPAHSLIADYFSRAERPRASGWYQQGINVGGIVAFFVAGWLNQFYGWRMMFLLISVPGFILAPLAWFTIREPRSTNSSAAVAQDVHPSPSHKDGAASSAGPAPSMAAVIITLWRNRSFRYVLYGFSLWYFFGYGVTNWQPTYFIRSFGMTSGEVGTWFAIVFGVSGLLGTHWGGVWASRYAAGDERLQLRAMAVINVAFNGILWSGIYLTHDYRIALALTALGACGGALIFGPLFATIQTLVPAGMRAMSIALVLLCANLIGMGFGPVAVGVLSDALHPLLGEESLRYALLALCPGYVIISWHFWHASKTVMQDIESTQLGTPEAARNAAHCECRPVIDRATW
jgi:sugar phosphate permease